MSTATGAKQRASAKRAGRKFKPASYLARTLKLNPLTWVYAKGDKLKKGAKDLTTPTPLRSVEIPTTANPLSLYCS